MDVITDFPADAQAAEPVRQGDGLLEDPAVDTQSGAVLGAAAGELRVDALGARQITVFVVVVGTVGAERVRVAARPAASAAYRWDELGGVVPVAAGHRGSIRSVRPRSPTACAGPH